MNNTLEKYLPIGTVVILKGATKKLMITGFCATEKDHPDMTFDYSGCMYPVGILDSEQTALFNHDQIEKIYHFGYVNDEELVFKERLNEVLKDLIEEKKKTKQSDASNEKKTEILKSALLNNKDENTNQEVSNKKDEFDFKFE